MSTRSKSDDHLQRLLNELLRETGENEWVEFKENDDNPQEIGEYISALSNSAALHGQAFAYSVWGVSDTDRCVVGTRFRPSVAKKGNEELENWLLRLLSPRIHFCFHEFQFGMCDVVLLEISRASTKPVQFQNQEYIRIGSYKKKLKDYPEHERALWRIFDETPFERLIAQDNLSDDEVLRHLHWKSYFELLGLKPPSDTAPILDRLRRDDMILPCATGGWGITNLGATLFARRLDDFQDLKRKAVRVIVYEDDSRIDTRREQIGSKGYACGFEGLIGFVNALVPSNEVIGTALRKNVPMYPELAVRELVANAVIHQDFFMRGTGPMVEIFSDRIEITNPGVPLVDTKRFLDSPPRSRNEALASVMRRIGVCEERGSGVDKVVFQTEFYQLPAPIFEVSNDHTRAVLFAHRPYAQMDRSDRIRACYLHACLRCVNRDCMTNSSLRGRFGIEKGNSSMVTRIIRDTMEVGMIKRSDESSESRRHARYLPFWA